VIAEINSSASDSYYEEGKSKLYSKEVVGNLLTGIVGVILCLWGTYWAFAPDEVSLARKILGYFLFT